MVDVNKEDDLYIANLSSNIMMYCPSFANDDVIVQVIHSKLAALAGDELIIGEIHLKGSDTALQYTFDCPDGQYMLPETTAEYYTEGVARDPIPWWARDDGFSFEFIRPKDSELSNEELFADVIDPLDEFYKAVTDSEDTPISITKEPAKIVQVEKWKPRKVE